jgi:hypothetical protein
MTTIVCRESGRKAVIEQDCINCPQWVWDSEETPVLANDFGPFSGVRSKIVMERSGHCGSTKKVD